jgi:hypothetical protein
MKDKLLSWKNSTQGKGFQKQNDYLTFFIENYVAPKEKAHSPFFIHSSGEGTPTNVKEEYKRQRLGYTESVH